MRPVQISVLISACIAAATSEAQPGPENFFQDKTIRILVGAPPGGSYDFYARLAADMLKAHIPTAKSVIIENRPGGGGIVAVNWFYAQAPRDGTVLGVLPETVGNTQLLEPDIGKWRVQDLRYIGSFTPVNSTFMRRRDSAAKTIEDMRTMNVNVGCTGATAQSYQYPALLRSLAGFKFKMICGYPGASEYSLALERGEIDLVSSAWNSWRVTHRRKISEGELVPVIQVGLYRNRELPDVPLMQELVSDESAKEVIEFFSAGSSIGRALVAPPALPDVRINYLRQVFQTMTSDPTMVELAAKRGLELEPTPGEVVQGYANRIVNTPSSIVARALEASKEK